MPNNIRMQNLSGQSLTSNETGIFPVIDTFPLSISFPFLSDLSDDQTWVHSLGIGLYFSLTFELKTFLFTEYFS